MNMWMGPQQRLSKRACHDSSPTLVWFEGPDRNDPPLAQIARFSLERAALRLTAARRRRESADEDEDAEADEAVAAARRVVNQVRHLFYQPGQKMVCVIARTCTLVNVHAP